MVDLLPVIRTTVCFWFAEFLCDVSFPGVTFFRAETAVSGHTFVKRIQETAARGISILYNREQLYEFLGVVRGDLQVLETPMLWVVTPEEYRTRPNVPALHEDVIRSVEAFVETVFVPRRRFPDQRVVGVASLFKVGASA